MAATDCLNLSEYKGTKKCDYNLIFLQKNCDYNVLLAVKILLKSRVIIKNILMPRNNKIIIRKRALVESLK